MNTIDWKLNNNHYFAGRRIKHTCNVWIIQSIIWTLKVQKNKKSQPIIFFEKECCQDITYGDVTSKHSISLFSRFHCVAENLQHFRCTVKLRGRRNSLQITLRDKDQRSNNHYILGRKQAFFDEKKRG